jgi:hypothetical protein
MAYTSKEKQKNKPSPIPEPVLQRTSFATAVTPKPESKPEFYTVIITKTCRDSAGRYHKGKTYRVTPELRDAMLKAGVADDKPSGA